MSLAFDQRDNQRAAGVLFLTRNGLALFLRRVDSGQWSIPAGGVEDEDTGTAVCAQREAAEEVGYPGDFLLQPIDRRTTHGVDFTTFVQPLEQTFDPILNGEHDQYLWAPVDDPPGPLHPGLAATFSTMQKNNVLDAAPRRTRDPTHTGTLRRAFRAAAELRLRKIRALLRVGVVDHDILGLNPERLNFAAPNARLTSFNSWFEAMTKLELASGWSYGWIDKAISSGEQQARKDLRGGHGVERGKLGFLHEWAQTELTGIAAALTQQVTRAAATITGSHRVVRPAAAFRLLAAPFAKISKQRLHPFAHDAMVRSHVKATLAVYRANQVFLVGVEAETNPRQRKHDHLTLRDQDEDEKLYGSITAGDDLVCFVCEDIADDAPYSVDEIDDLLPAHPRCRCQPYPWFDLRFAGDALTVDAYDEPEHPRGEHGRWISKEGEALTAKAKEHFGLTDRLKEAGYVLPDGSMLDFSGRHQSLNDYRREGLRWVPKHPQRTPDYLAGQRQVDHRDLYEVVGPTERPGSTSEDQQAGRMYGFMHKTGAIRTGVGGYEMTRPPTDRQLRTLLYGHRRSFFGEPFRVELSTKTGEQLAHQEFARPSVAGIKHWLAIQTRPENTPFVDYDPGQPVAEMRAAIQAAQPTHPDHVQQIMGQALAAIADSGSAAQALEDWEFPAAFRDRFEAALHAALDYSPEQPRVPAGSAEGGEFAGGGGWSGEPLRGSAGDPGLISTALTTAAGRTKAEREQIKSESHNYQRIDLAQAKKSPVLFAGMVDTFRNGDLFPYMRSSDFNGNAEHDSRAVIDRIKSNLRVLWDDAAQANKDLWRHWYVGAHNLISERMQQYPGVGRAALTAAYAAMSPNTMWDVNVHLGDRLLDTVFNHASDKWDKGMADAAQGQLERAEKNLDKAKNRARVQKNLDAMQKIFGEIKRAGSFDKQKDDYHRAAWVKLWNDVHDDTPVYEVGIDGKLGKPIKNKGLDDNGEPSDLSGRFGQLGRIENALHALRSGGNVKKISEALGNRHKVRSFYNNILDPHAGNDDVTVDTHAAGAAWLDPFGGKSPILGQMFGSSGTKGVPNAPKSARFGVQGTYPFYADAFRELAHEVGLGRGRELQSILWEHKIKLFRGAPDAKKELIHQVWQHFHDHPGMSLEQAQQRVLRIAKAGYNAGERRKRTRDATYDYQFDETEWYSSDEG